MRKSTFWKNFTDFAVLMGLGIFDAVSFNIFIVGNFVPMGMNGIAVMIQYVVGIESGWFSWFSLIANFPLCVLVFIFVDKEFAVKSYFYVATLSVAYYLMSHYTPIANYAYHGGDANGENINVLLPVLASSVISGIIYGIVFKKNASTGGMDVAGKLVAYMKPQLNFIWVSFTFSAMVAISSYFVMNNDMQQVILCIIFSFTSTFIGNTILKGTRSALKVEVVTVHAEEISEKIINELHHTATVTKAQGMYKHTEYDLLICIINKRQLYDLEKILKPFPDTFAFVSQVSSTVGLFNRGK